MSGHLTSRQLKITAMGTMFLDHAAVAVIENTGLNEMSPLAEQIGIAMRLIGRVAFPLYAFLLVQGFMWTRNWKNYAMRLAALALISEIPFNLVASGKIWYPDAQNTVVTLLLGLLCMKMLESLEQKDARMIFVIAGFMLAAELLRADYGAAGVLLIAVLYWFRHRPAQQVEAGCAVMILIYGFSWNVWFAWIAFFLISRYNGERGRKLGSLPYGFYPAHLLALGLAGAWIMRVL